MGDRAQDRAHGSEDKPGPTPFFRSEREPTLWAVLALSLFPVALAAFLLSLRSPAEPAGAFGGGLPAWLFRAALLLVSSVLFWPMAWLSGRYVLRVDRRADGRLSFTTWTLLGHRDRPWSGSRVSTPSPRYVPREGSDAVFHLRDLLRPLLRELVGRRERIWPGGPTLYEGRTHLPGRVWVDAPFVSLAPLGGGTLIIDLQGDFPQGYDVFLAAIRPVDLKLA